MQHGTATELLLYLQHIVVLKKKIHHGAEQEVGAFDSSHLHPIACLCFRHDIKYSITMTHQHPL